MRIRSCLCCSKPLLFTEKEYCDNKYFDSAVFCNSCSLEKTGKMKQCSKQKKEQPENDRFTNASKTFTLAEVETIARDATYQAIETDTHFNDWWVKKVKEFCQ